MNPLARVRHQLARRPWLYWLAVAGAAGVVGLVVADATSRVESARRVWGRDRSVLVAQRDAEPGDLLADVAVTAVRPEPLVPAAALDEAAGPEARLRQHVRAGEVLVDADVVATADPAALIPTDWRALAVAEPVPSGADVGDRVEIAAGGVRLSEDGVVVGLRDDAVLVAVPADVAPMVALAASSGEAVLLLAP